MAQAASIDTRSNFIAQLLAPLSSQRENRRLAAEVRREAERAWSTVYHGYYAAQAYRSYCSHRRSLATFEGRTCADEATEEQRAYLALLTAIDRLMHIPAPTLGALRMKQKMRGADGVRDRWEAAIAADKARLEKRPLCLVNGLAASPGAVISA